MQTLGHKSRLALGRLAMRAGLSRGYVYAPGKSTNTNHMKNLNKARTKALTDVEGKMYTDGIKNAYRKRIENNYKYALRQHSKSLARSKYALTGLTVLMKIHKQFGKLVKYVKGTPFRATEIAYVLVVAYKLADLTLYLSQTNSENVDVIDHPLVFGTIAAITPLLIRMLVYLAKKSVTYVLQFDKISKMKNSARFCLTGYTDKLGASIDNALEATERELNASNKKQQATAISKQQQLANKKHLTKTKEILTRMKTTLEAFQEDCKNTKTLKPKTLNTS
jgi:hypothetical protein